MADTQQILDLIKSHLKGAGKPADDEAAKKVYDSAPSLSSPFQGPQNLGRSDRFAVDWWQKNVDAQIGKVTGTPGQSDTTDRQAAMDDLQATDPNAFLAASAANWVVQQGILSSLPETSTDWMDMTTQIIAYYQQMGMQLPSDFRRMLDTGDYSNQIAASSQWLGARSQDPAAYVVLAGWGTKHVSKYAAYAETKDGVSMRTISDLTKDPEIGGFAMAVTHQAVMNGVDAVAGADVYKQLVRTGKIQPMQVLTAQTEDMIAGKMTVDAADRLSRSAEKQLNNYLSDYAKYERQFGDHLVALVALEDPSLAYKIKNNPAGVTRQEAEKIRNITGSTDEDRYVRAALGGSLRTYHPEEENFLDTLYTTTMTPSQVDEGSLLSAARTIAAAWNMPDLTDQEVKDLVSGAFADQKRRTFINSQINPLGQSDTTQAWGESAYPSDFLRKTPEYKRLFGNMPGGLTEEQYSGQFQAKANELLGQANPDVARAGQEQNSMAAVRSAAIMSGAGAESSTFTDRVARFGEIMRSR